MQPEPMIPGAIYPYDLVAPQKLLYPGSVSGVKVDEVKLAGQSARLQRIAREGGTSYRLVIDCENMPHCDSCECETHHWVNLTPEAIEAMKGLLP